MEVPDLLTHRLDGEPRATVALEGEDIAVVTRDRTFIYREEGLLSDASVEVYSNSIERLSISQGRRKTTFQLGYIDDSRQFAVTNSRAEVMLEKLFGGILASTGVLDDSERIRGVYLFSDLTVVVTDGQLLKHIGEVVWETDAETYPFDAVTGLDFEEGNVATQVVLWVAGRAERIKAPSEDAPLLQRTLTQALCEYHGVDSLEQLNEISRTEPEDASSSSIALEDGISPLIETPDDGPTDDAGEDTAGAVTDDDWLKPDDRRSSDDTRSAGARQAGDRSPDSAAGTTTGVGATATTGDRSGDPDIEELEQRIAELTRAVDRQNELLERQARQLAALTERVDGE